MVSKSNGVFTNTKMITTRFITQNVLVFTARLSCYMLFYQEKVKLVVLLNCSLSFGLALLTHLKVVKRYNYLVISKDFSRIKTKYIFDTNRLVL